MNIVKTGFFILLKRLKNSGVFTNFCYGSHRDDFYILIPARLLKVGPNKPNTSEKVILKPNLYRPKDCHRSMVSKGVTTGNNGFKDPNSWESIERGPYMPEDRPCEPVESQEVTVGPNKAPIGGLDLETSRGTVKKRLYMLAELRNVEKTDDIYRNPKGYNVLLQLTSLWHIRLKHLSLNLFKKTVKIINGMPNLDVVKEEDLVYLVYDRSKAIRKFNLKALLNLLRILDTLKGDTFKIKSKPYNKRFIKLFIIDHKSRFKWMILLSNR